MDISWTWQYTNAMRENQMIFGLKDDISINVVINSVARFKNTLSFLASSMYLFNLSRIQTSKQVVVRTVILPLTK